MTRVAILCVDDERIILMSLRDQLSKYFGDRYRYEFAESVDEAWEVIEELHRADVKIVLVVSDWLMPRVKGDEFLIQVHRQFPQVITILLSGQVEPSAIERTRRFAKLRHYLPKPWDEKTLVQVIETSLEGIDE